MSGTRSPRKVLVLVSAMGPGGAERVASILVNAWAQAGHAVTLLVTSAHRDACFYPVSARARTVHLADEVGGRVPGLARGLARLLAIRRLIGEHDVAISFLTNVNVAALLASLGTRVPVFVCERIHPPALPVGILYEWLRRLTYPWAERVVLLAPQSLRWLEETIPSARGLVIPNPAGLAVPDSEPRVAPDTVLPPGRRVLLAVGRLSAQKGFDVLLECFARLAGAHGEWDLVILGEGQLRGDLRSRVAALSLHGRVHLPGAVGNMAQWYRRAQVFVLSSRFEGFPNALVEAMGHGLAAVAFDCETGPREIVRDGIDGLLVRPVGGAQALAAALSPLMSDDARRQRLGAAASTIGERFPLAGFLGQWQAASGIEASLPAPAASLRAAPNAASPRTAPDASSPLVIVDPNTSGGHVAFCHSLAVLLAADARVCYVNREPDARAPLPYRHQALGDRAAGRWARLRAYGRFLGALREHDRAGAVLFFQSVNLPLLAIIVAHLARRGRRARWLVALHNAVPHEPRLRERLAIAATNRLVASRFVDLAVYYVERLREDALRRQYFGAAVAAKMRFVPHHRFTPAAESRGSGVPAPAPAPEPGGSASRREPGRPLRLLVFGVIRRNKGVVEFLSRLGASSVPAGTLALTIAGPCEAALAARVREAARALAGRVAVTVLEGPVSDAHKAALFAGADYALLPYRDEFVAQSGVAIDAYEAGVPLLVSGNASLRHLVATDGSGYVYEDDFERVFTDVAFDAAAYRACVARIAALCATKYADAAVRARYEELFASLEGNSRPGVESVTGRGGGAA